MLKHSPRVVFQLLLALLGAGGPCLAVAQGSAAGVSLSAAGAAGAAAAQAASGSAAAAPAAPTLAVPRIVGKSADAAVMPPTGARTEGGLESLPPNEANEFQNFVLEATGKQLPIYGASFLSSRAVAPLQAIPVPGDHPLGPGDEVLIRGWGAVEIDVRAVIDRHGLINIPKVGTVPLAGVKAAQAEDVIRAAIGKVYRGFSLSVTMGQLRGITVYVVGQARRPGSYTVSSLSTLVTALFESGGPNANGSLRRVQVNRDGRRIAEMDLYAFISRGDKSGDVKLLDGDVIVIPPAAGRVALTGNVKTPAIYELRDKEETLASLLEFAGGVPIFANPRRVLLERIDPARMQPRTVEQFPLDAESLKKTLKDGDLLSVLSILPEFSNAVTLQLGNGEGLRLPYQPGMKITDLIPSKDFLITQASLRKQNQVRAQADDLRLRTMGNKYDEFNWDYAVVERLDRANLSASLLSFSPGNALGSPASRDNLLLQPGDTVTIFSADDVRIPIALRRVIVRIEGEVRRPGVYQVAAGENLVNLITRAGGTTTDAYLFGAEFYRESVRRSQQENLDKFVRKIEQAALSESGRLAANQVVSDAQAQTRLAVEADNRNRFMQRLRELKSTGRMTLGLAPAATGFALLPDVRLENGDRLLIPSRPDFVQVLGSVSTESSQFWQPGRTVADYLALAGVTADADSDSTFVMRADGSVISNTGRWLSSVRGAEALPGDLIVIPEKFDKETYWTGFWRTAKDFTQVFMNFGIGAAAVKTLGK